MNMTKFFNTIQVKTYIIYHNNECVEQKAGEMLQTYELKLKKSKF